MIDYNGIRDTVVSGLSSYLNYPVIRANQNAAAPDYPFISYTVTALGENNGTRQEYSDNTARLALTQTWSICAISDDNLQSVTLADKSREWLSHYGATYLNDNSIYVQSVGAITNRDNILSIEYEYKNGFDVVFWVYDTENLPLSQTGWIESVYINESPVPPVTDYEALDNALVEQVNTLDRRLHKRINGE